MERWDEAVHERYRFSCRYDLNLVLLHCHSSRHVFWLSDHRVILVARCYSSGKKEILDIMNIIKRPRSLVCKMLFKRPLVRKRTLRYFYHRVTYYTTHRIQTDKGILTLITGSRRVAAVVRASDVTT